MKINKHVEAMGHGFAIVMLVVAFVAGVIGVAFLLHYIVSHEYWILLLIPGLAGLIAFCYYSGRSFMRAEHIWTDWEREHRNRGTNSPSPDEGRDSSIPTGRYR